MKKIKFVNIKFSSLILISIMFSGCGQEPFPGNTIQEASIYHDKSKNSGIEILSIPSLNTVNTIEVGENLYQKINQQTFDTYTVKLLENTQAKLFNGGYIITNNDNSLNEDLLYKWKNKNAMCFPSGYDSSLQRPIKICLVDDTDENNFSQAVYSYKDKKYPLTNKAKYEIIPSKPKYNKDSFKYEALYQGKKGNSIKISFREFRNDMARPAFTQDIDYELEKDDTTFIGFKGLRIQVLKATNMDITYKVLNFRT